MLKFQLETMDGIDEATAPLYKETEGGGFVLQVEGAIPETVLAETKQKLVDANEEAGRRRKALDKWKALGDTPDAVLERINAKGKPNEDHERIIAEMKANHATEMDAGKVKLQSILKKSALSDLKAQLAGESIVPAGLEPLTLMALQRVTFDNDGDLRIMSPDGTKPLAGSGADGYATVSDLAKELAASDTGQLFVKDGGASGGGKPPASGNGKPQSKTVTRTQFDAMSHVDRGTFAKEGGKVVDG